MSRKLLIAVLALSMTSGALMAQVTLFNEATIKVENGAKLFVEGGVENTASGTLDNDGTIEIEGDFINAGSFIAMDSVIYSGGTDSDVTSGGGTFNYVQVDKDATFGVNLVDEMNVDGELNFAAASNDVTLGASNLNIGDAGSISGAAADRRVVTDGAGALNKEGFDAGESFSYPVGGSDGNYNPATLTANAAHASDNLSVRVLNEVLEDGESGASITEGVVRASWDIDEGTPGGSDVDIEVQWSGTDEGTDFSRDSSGIARHDGAAWGDLVFDEIDAADGADPYLQQKDSVMNFSPFAVSGKALASSVDLMLTVNLEGAWNGTDMDDNLRGDPTFPLTEPYTGYGFTIRGFGGGETTNAGVLANQANTDEDIVDWALIGLRDKNNVTSIKGSAVGLIQRNGVVANADGSTPLTISGVDEDDYYVVVEFKHSLAVISNATVSFAGGVGTADFTDGTLTAAADNQKDLGGGVYGLYTADANANGFIDSADRSLLWNLRNTPGYTQEDATMNLFIDSADRSVCWNNRNEGTVVPAGS